MPYISSLFRWLQRKRYQYEVTFSLYMLTPTEKIIFNSFLFLFLSMIIIAASLYLPEHVSSIVRRLCFYWGGDETAAVESGISGTGSIMSEAASLVLKKSGPGAGVGSEMGDVLHRLGEL